MNVGMLGRFVSVFAFLCVLGVVYAQEGGNFIGTSGAALGRDSDAQVRYQRELASRARNFIPRDPWREIDGVTNYAKGSNWVEFSGEVIDVQADGIFVDGQYSHPFSYYIGYSGVFFVARFPYAIADRERVSGYSAKMEGLYTYRTTQGGTSTVRKLDYGITCPIPTNLVAVALARQAQIMSEQDAIRAAKHEKAEDAIVRWLEGRATNGDMDAQCELGERFLHGDGVSTNIDAARYWLTISADRGSIEASNVLRSVGPAMSATVK